MSRCEQYQCRDIYLHRLVALFHPIRESKSPGRSKKARKGAFERRFFIGFLKRLPLVVKTVGELSGIQYRKGFKEAKEDVLFIMRRGCRAGLELL
jgi:hypothetical protein